jgi:hypothetical protein
MAFAATGAEFVAALASSSADLVPLRRARSHRGKRQKG